jgi:hypothetical protein
MGHVRRRDFFVDTGGRASQKRGRRGENALAGGFIERLKGVVDSLYRLHE